MHEMMVGSLRDVNISAVRSSSFVKEGNNGTSFMDILSSKMQDESISHSKAFSAFPVKRKSSILSGQRTENKLKNQKDAADTVSSRKPDEVQSPETDREDKDDVKKPDNLESILLFLQDILSSLNLDSTSMSMSDLDSTETQAVFLETQLKQIQELAVKYETLENLAEQLSDADLIREFADILEVINELSDRTADMNPDLTATVEQTLPELSQLVDQLRTQCSEVIQKLQYKVSVSDANQINLEKTLIDKKEISKEEVLPTEMKPDQEELIDSAYSEESVSNTENKVNANYQNDRPNDSKGKNEDASARDMSSHDFSQQMNYAELSKYNLQQEQDKIIEINQQPVSAAEKMPLPMTEKFMSQSVTNQVMMKVKLMAGENKQEMEMHLEPETLGKLSLRIIHEKGEILAKITAESEQVKQILESNMQMLKDSLERNGFSVQNLSVSVGNGRKEQSQQKQDQPGTGYNMRIPSKNPEIEVSTETIYSPDKLNYYYEDSQIDLTA